MGLPGLFARRINHKGTKSKTNTRTTALERSVPSGVGRGCVEALLLANFTLGPNTTLNTEIHKYSVRIKALNSVNATQSMHLTTRVITPARLPIG